MPSTEGLSIAALAVAALGGASSIYAVVISRRALRWEQDRNETKVTIAFGHATNFKAFARVINLNDPSPIPPEPMFYELTVSVVNSGETTEFVKTLWVEKASGGEGVDYSPNVDVELKPHSRWSTAIDAAELPDPEGGVVGIAHLANGTEIRSSVDHLIGSLNDDVERHNRGIP
jgi:hypothetical protein